MVAVLGLCFALFHFDSPDSVPLIAWTIAAILCFAYGVMDRLTRDEFGEYNENPISIIATLIALFFVTFGSTVDWAIEQRCFLLALPGIFVPLALRHEKLRSLCFDTLLVFLFISPVALISLFTEGNLPTSTLLIAASISLITSALHTRFPIKVGNFVPNLFDGVHLALATLLLVVEILTRDLSSDTRLLLLLLIPIAGTLVSYKSKLLIHSCIPAFSYLAFFFVGSPETPTLLFGTLACLSHLILLRKTHTLIDKKLLEATSFLFTTGFFLNWTMDAISEPIVLISWSAVGILLSVRFIPKTLTYVAASVYFMAAVNEFLMAPPSLAVYLSLLAPAGLHLWNCHQKIDPKFNLLAIGAIMALWIQITRDSSLNSLSASWAVTGTVLLLTGLILRSRTFRLYALVVLLASLGHVMLIDIVKLDPLPRILSFITLGLGLLGLGFVYNRWQERLKQIL